MLYQTLFSKKEKGFSLIELIVVVAVFLVIMGISETAFFNFQSHSNLEMTANNIVEAIRHAKANAEQVQGDSKWGVEIIGNQIVVFSTASDYNNRNISLDQTIPLSGGVTLSGLPEIIFEKASGSTSNFGTITISSSYGSKNIIINAKGTITY